MIRCDSCIHKDKDGHDEPCIGCVECGVPYVEVTDRELKDFFEEEEVQ